jgi:hypothetical protein
VNFPVNSDQLEMLVKLVIEGKLDINHLLPALRIMTLLDLEDPVEPELDVDGNVIPNFRHFPFDPRLDENGDFRE